MYNTVATEAVFCLTCIASGTVIAFLYDILRISRRIVRSGAVLVNAEDAVFLGLAALAVFYAAYIKNGGEVRVWGILCVGFGIFGYFLVVKNRIVNLGTAVLLWSMKCLAGAARVVLFPFKLFMKALKKPVAIVAWYTGRGLRRARRLARKNGAQLKARAKSIDFMLRKK